jgi:hypothetical protein
MYELTTEDLNKLQDMQKDKRSGLRWCERNGMTFYNEEQINKMFKKVTEADRIAKAKLDDAKVKEAIKQFRGIK